MKIASVNRMVIRMPNYVFGSIRSRRPFPQATANSAGAGPRVGSTMATIAPKGAAENALTYPVIRNEDPEEGRGMSVLAREQRSASTACRSPSGCPHDGKQMLSKG
jgi:hypothetical protein